MSKQVPQNSLGTTILIKGAPASAEEFDEMSGEMGACLNAAIDDYIKHNWLTKFRSAFVKALEEHTGVERVVVKTIEKKSGGEPTKVYEKDSLYIAKVEEETGKSMAEYNDLAQKVADGIPFDLTGSRTSGRIGKEWLEAAESLVEKVEDKGGDYSKFVNHITENNPSFQFVIDEATGNPTVESIAFAIKVDMERRDREQKAELAALA